MGDPFLAWLELAQRVGSAMGAAQPASQPRSKPRANPPQWHDLDPLELCAVPRSVPGRAVIVYPGRMPDGSTVIELAEWPSPAYLGPLEVAEQIATSGALPVRLSVYL